LAVLLIATTSATAVQIGSESDVYAALFRSTYPSLKPLSKMIVKDVAIPMPTLTGSAVDWLEQFEEVPAALRVAASQPAPTRARAFGAGSFPSGTRLVSDRAIQALFVRGIEENWTLFRRQFAAEGWVAFSEVIFADDGKDALVYYEGRCGGLCGEGGYVWLHREQPQSRWFIRKKILRWVS
jgi:hypothetical protein